MNKTGKRIYDELIIDDLGTAKPAQIGVDLSIAKIEEIHGYAHFDENSKVHGITYQEAPYKEKDGVKLYYLEPRTDYAITLQQGIKPLRDNEWGIILQRSSFIRCGCHLVSSAWDPGFHTNSMGTTLTTGPIPVVVPVGTRVGQLIIFDCEEVSEEDLYNGTWQGKANA